MILEKISLLNLRNLDFYNVMLEVEKILKQYDLTALGLDALSQEFSALLSEFESLLNISSKSVNTEKMRIVDLQRDHILRIINHVCSVLNNSPVAELSLAANRVEYVMNKYGGHLEKLAYNEKTTAVTRMLEDFEITENSEAITSLKLQEWSADLSTLNTTFSDLQVERDMEVKPENGACKEARDKVNSKFEELCELINALNLLSPNPAYPEIADAINTAVANAKELAKRRQTLSDNDEDKDNNEK